MKKCKECSKEFEPITTKGSEQIYCSKICRGRAASERFKKNLINTYEKHNSNTRTTNFEGNLENEQATQKTILNERMGNYQDESRGFNTGNFIYNRHDREFTSGNNRRDEYSSGARDFNRLIELIEENARLRAEVTILNQKIFNLESELTEYELEEDMEEEQTPGFLGNILNAYKQDPTSTVLFAKDMIFEFLKPQTNEPNKTNKPKANG